MKLKSITAALALFASASSMAATCTDTFSLGTLGAGDYRFLFNDFTTPKPFRDCYSFTLSESATASGFTFEWDGSNRLNIDLAYLSLSGGGLVSAISDPSPGSYTFGGLAAGLYQLALVGTVTDTGSARTDGGVGYFGILKTGPAGAITPVPEPQTLAMLALGVGTMVWGARRRS